MAGWGGEEAQVLSYSAPEEEVFIGKDVRAFVGQRVQVRAGLRQEGQGTIKSVDPNGIYCNVSWDSGKEDRRLITGDDGRGYLVSAVQGGGMPLRDSNRKSTGVLATASPASNGNGWPSGPASSPYVTGSVNSRLSGEGARPMSIPKSPTFAVDYMGQDDEEAEASFGKHLLDQTAEEISRLSVKDAPQSLPANISNARTTVGLTVFGTRVDYLVPGGPAHLCQMLDKGDEITAVNGRPVSQDDVSEAIIGSDQPGTIVELSVVKSGTGALVSVTIPRVLRSTIQNMVNLFQLLTQLKQNGHNNAAHEAENLPPGSVNTVALVDRVVSMIAMQQLQIHSEKELAARNTFSGSATEQQLRNEVMQLRAIVKKSEIEREEVSDFLKEVQRTSAENEAAFDQQLKSLLSEKQQMLNQIAHLQKLLEQERSKCDDQATHHKDEVLQNMDEIHILQQQNMTVQNQLVVLQQEMIALAQQQKAGPEPEIEAEPEPEEDTSQAAEPELEIRGFCDVCKRNVTIEDARVKLETGEYVHADCYQLIQKKPDTLIGIKIQDYAPHLVQKVVDLVDQDGVCINDLVGVGDELVYLDDIHVKALGVGHVARMAVGPEGSLVKMTFLRANSVDDFYSVTVQRHLAPQKADTMALVEESQAKQERIRFIQDRLNDGLPEHEHEVGYDGMVEADVMGNMVNGMDNSRLSMGELEVQYMSKEELDRVMHTSLPKRKPRLTPNRDKRSSYSPKMPWQLESLPSQPEANVSSISSR